MPKRKADEGTRAKAASRPLPSTADNNDDDSDFCDIIEAPSGAINTPARPPGISQQQRAVFGSPFAPGLRANPALPLVPSHPPFDPNNAGVLSMLAGLSGAMPYMQPGQYNQMQGAFVQRHSMGYGAPNMLASQAGFQETRFIPGPSMPHQMIPPFGGMPSAQSPGEWKH